jgi:hypothetical protein
VTATGSTPSSSSFGDVLEHVLRRHLEVLDGLGVAQVRGEELVDLASVGAGEADHRVDDRHVGRHAHVHLRWHLGGELREVSVTLEVLESPAVERLYFWALQTDLAGHGGRHAGGAHLGLQWHPSHPGSRAVNWGGYDARGTELRGSGSPLPSALRNPNTRDLWWSERTPYRLTIERAPADADRGGLHAWRGAVTDLATGRATVVRDLWVPGDRITGVVMWSEVFARCDDPSVAVRWSDPSATLLDGVTVRPDRLSVNYQTHADGGCANTDSSPDGAGVVQRTDVARSSPSGAVLPTR